MAKAITALRRDELQRDMVLGANVWHKKGLYTFGGWDTKGEGALLHYVDSEGYERYIITPNRYDVLPAIEDVYSVGDIVSSSYGKMLGGVVVGLDLEDNSAIIRTANSRDRIRYAYKPHELVHGNQVPKPHHFEQKEEKNCPCPCPESVKLMVAAILVGEPTSQMEDLVAELEVEEPKQQVHENPSSWIFGIGAEYLINGIPHLCELGYTVHNRECVKLTCIESPSNCFFVPKHCDKMELEKAHITSLMRIRKEMR